MSIRTLLIWPFNNLPICQWQHVLSGEVIRKILEGEMLLRWLSVVLGKTGMEEKTHDLV